MKKVTVKGVGVVGVTMALIECTSPLDDGKGCMLHFNSGRVLIVEEPESYFIVKEAKTK